MKTIQLNRIGVILSTAGIMTALIGSSVDVVSARTMASGSTREECIQALQVINSMQATGCDDSALIELRKDAIQELEKLNFKTGQLETLKIKPNN
jgi:hypothetical protein